MSRRAKPKKRIPAPDAVFGDVEVAKFINRLMNRGKKSTAEGIFYDAIEIIKGKSSEDGLVVFKRALQKAKPLVRVKARRVGGSTYQVPIEVRDDEGIAIGSRWMIEFARKRKGRSMSDKLAQEILDIYNGLGATMKRREDTHKMAEANKAFAHYRF